MFPEIESIHFKKYSRILLLRSLEIKTTQLLLAFASAKMVSFLFNIKTVPLSGLLLGSPKGDFNSRI